MKDLYDLCVYYSKLVENEHEDLQEFANSPLNSENDFGIPAKSISLHERTAVKLLPIVEEVLKILVKESVNFELDPTCNN